MRREEILGGSRRRQPALRLKSEGKQKLLFRGPGCCEAFEAFEFSPDGFDAAASVTEAQLFTAGHFMKGGGGVIQPR